MSDFKVGYFYVMTQDAKSILDVIFKAGVIPGKVIVISDEDFEILREGMRSYPVMILGQKPSGIVVPMAN